jgi:hypothetical protein
LLRFGGRGKKGTCFCWNIVPEKGIPGKLPLEKRNMKRNSFFLQELGSYSPGFLDLESLKKECKKECTT